MYADFGQNSLFGTVNGNKQTGIENKLRRF